MSPRTDPRLCHHPARRILEAWPALGTISGPFHEGALDFIYLSVVTFSTLGFGDFLPTGPITILCGTEALLGLTFIAWTASVAFLEMQHDWVEFRRHRPPQPTSEPGRDSHHPSGRA